MIKQTLEVPILAAEDYNLFLFLFYSENTARRFMCVGLQADQTLRGFKFSSLFY